MAFCDASRDEKSGNSILIELLGIERKEPQLGFFADRTSASLSGRSVSSATVRFWRC